LINNNEYLQKTDLVYFETDAVNGCEDLLSLVFWHFRLIKCPVNLKLPNIQQQPNQN